MLVQLLWGGVVASQQRAELHAGRLAWSAQAGAQRGLVGCVAAGPVGCMGNLFSCSLTWRAMHPSVCKPCCAARA